MNLSFRQLHAFVTVARLGSFTRAAEELHLTQAGLSLMIKEMEGQLGYRLFDRTTRSVWLTSAGERFLPVVTRSMNDINETAGRLARDEALARQSLTVAATTFVCGTILPAVMQTMASSHPDIHIVVRDVERSQLQRMVAGGEADLGVGILLKPVSGIHRKAIHELTLVCVSPAQGAPNALKPARDTKTRTLKWAELRHTPLIGLPPDNGIQQLIDEQLSRIGRANEPRATYQNITTLMGMVEVGLGCTILPSFVRTAQGRYRVEIRDMAAPRAPLDFFMVTKKGVAQPAAATAFLQALKTQLEAA
ncbi:MAG: LysR family transcriptional regulator [Hydrogenophaga sp.]|nr:LysR family transcriptional regulator [Hydrogenophaga sp.]